MPSSFPCIPASEKCWCPKFCTNFQTGLWYSPQNAIFTWDKKAYRSEKVYSAEIKCLCRVVFSCIWQTLKCTKNSRIHSCYDSFILLLLWKLEATLQMCNGLKAKWHWSGLCSRYAKMYVLKLRFFFFLKATSIPVIKPPQYLSSHTCSALLLKISSVSYCSNATFSLWPEKYNKS